MDHAGRPSAPPGPVLKVCFPSVRASVLENLNRQREEGQLCDLSIQVQGHVFRAHRCVLAASSPYFHDQVLLKNVTTVSLPSVMDPMAFESVLNSAYTGQLSIVREDIVSYVTVASFLQMWHIVDKCTDILKRSRPLPQLSPCGATSSSHQSPSSSDCCFPDTEEREAGPERRALPPLATWRRPQARGTRLSLQGLPVPSWTPAPGETEPGCARNRARARLRDPAERMREDEEQRRRSERWMEADEGVGELLEPDKVRVKCEAGGPEPEGRLGEGQADGACAAGPWEPGVDWALHTPAARKHEEQEQEEMDVAHFEGAFQTYDEIEEGTGQVSQRPLLPASPDPFTLGPAQPQTASPGSCSCPPLAAPSSPLSGTAYTGKVHFCHCGKAYTMKSMRDRHVKMQHLNLRPFACPVCSKSFKMKHHLTKHVKTHEGLLPYECSLCGKKIVWRDSFLKHQARCQRLSAGPSGLKREEEEEEEEEEGSGGGGLGFERDDEEVKVERDDYSSQEEETLLNIKL